MPIITARYTTFGTGGTASFLLPPTLLGNSIDVELWGARGGINSDWPNVLTGRGSMMHVSIPANPGDIIYMEIGAHPRVFGNVNTRAESGRGFPNGGWVPPSLNNGGASTAGGGRSAIFRNGLLYAVAGGGGGVGIGSASIDSPYRPPAGWGGDAGYPEGQPGGDGYPNPLTSVTLVGGGKGGTATVGGAGGATTPPATSTTGYAGGGASITELFQGIGGNFSNQAGVYPGGAGGGGWTGGGAGARVTTSDNWPGGGGGGSSWHHLSDATLIEFQNGVTQPDGDGLIILIYGVA